jgi:hypothetical protein
MPTDAGAALAESQARALLRDRRALRLGLGVALVFLLAMAFDWTFAYLAPLFAPPLLQAPASPRPAEALKLVAGTFAVMLGSYFVSEVARVLPMLFLLLLIPMLFLNFRWLLRGGPVLLVLMVLVGLILPPLVAKFSTDYAWDTAASFFGNIGLCVVVAYLMFAILPPRDGEPAPKPRPVLAPAEADARAATMAIITGAFAIVYFAFDWHNVHTPLYIALYIQSLTLSRTLVLSRGILLANVAGGIVATVMYELVAMAPNFLFLSALTVAVLVPIARLVVSDAPWAPLAGFAMSVTLLLLGDAMAPFADTASEGMAYRLFELGVAALYSVAAVFVLQAFGSSRAAPA